MTRFDGQGFETHILHEHMCMGTALCGLGCRSQRFVGTDVAQTLQEMLGWVDCMIEL